MEKIEVRFWSKVNVKGKDECWLWTAAKNHNGYGQFNNGVSNCRPHRWLWEREIGPIPNGTLLLHRCDNRACVNPNHLWLGTAQDNTDDMIVKGRHKFKSILTESDVYIIRERLAKGDMHKDIAKDYNVSRATITDINTRKRWRYLA